jgi:hypothetical protein
MNLTAKKISISADFHLNSNKGALIVNWEVSVHSCPRQLPGWNSGKDLLLLVEDHSQSWQTFQANPLIIS